MQLQNAIQNVFVQLTASLELLTDSQYVHASRILSNATIGQHTRHIIELFTCLEEGYDKGIVNYEHRKRDLAIETQKNTAIVQMKNIYSALGRENKPLLLQGSYNDNTAEEITVETNYFREIIYNLEHAIHHMALIKVGIREVSAIEVPDEFGVASSTLKFRAACAQ